MAKAKPKSKANSNLIPAAAYLRRSTKGQEASIREQRSEVKKYADRNGYVIIREYVDDGISGDATEKRLAFLQMREDTASGKFKAVLCWDQERFGRFDSVEAGYWIYPFRQAGVYVDTVNDGKINWEDFAGRVNYNIKQEGKHQYLQDLSRNVLRGQIEAAKKGSWVGSVPYGYKLEGERKNKKLVLGDRAKVKIVKRIFKEYVEDGRSMLNIASRLAAEGIPNPGANKKIPTPRWKFDAVKHILQNVAYIGTFKFNVSTRAKYWSYRNGVISKVNTNGDKLSKNNRKPESDWIVIPNHHDPIVDLRTFNKAQAILAKGKTGRPPHTPETTPYKLTGILKCGRCGAPMWGTGENHATGLYYGCSRVKRHGDCEGTTVREDRVLEQVAEYINSEFLSHKEDLRLFLKAKKGQLKPTDLPDGFKKLKRLILGKTTTPKTDPKQLEKELSRIDGEMGKLKRNLGLVDPEHIPDLQAQLSQLKDERADVIHELAYQPTEIDINETVMDVLRKMFDLYNLRRIRVWRPVLRELESITVHTEIKGKKSPKGTKGKKTRRHHTLCGADIKFKSVSGNKVIQGKLNPRLPD